MKINFSKLLHSESFIKHVLIISAGTGLTQLLSFVIAPVLTRLYAPAFFGSFAVFSSISSLITVLATGKYDTAIVLPELEEDAYNLARVALILTIVVSGLCLMGIAVFNTVTVHQAEVQEIRFWLYLVPLSVIFSGLYQIYYSLSVRKKKFAQISVGKISGALCGNVTNIFCGILNPNVGGLILGSLINQITLTSLLAWRFRGKNIYIFSRNIYAACRAIALRHYRFPLYSLPSDFVNVAAQQVPVLFIGYYFGTSAVGYFSITLRVLAMPLTLVASSITDVFRQRASSDYCKTGSCRSIFIKTLLSLSAFSIIPFLLFLVGAPWIFAEIFGEHWRIAGEYARIMAPLYLLRFVVSPLSYVFYIAERQKTDLIGNLTLLLLATLSLVIGGGLGSIKIALILYSLGYSIVYITYLILSYRFTIKGGLHECS